MDTRSENESEYELLNVNVKSILREYLEELGALNTKLNEDYVKILKDVDVKHEQFNLLCGALQEKINVTESVNIEDPPLENTVHTLKILNANIDQLNVVKKQHMNKFRTAVQSELVLMWDKCYFGEDQRKNCLSYYHCGWKKSGWRKTRMTI